MIVTIIDPPARRKQIPPDVMLRSWGAVPDPRINRKQLARCIRICEIVAEDQGIKPVDLFRRTRRHPVAFARQLAMVIMRETLRMPIMVIGSLFDRHHACVLQASRQVEARCASPYFASSLSHLLSKANA
jgi:chromosomal replication initiation ATPase DnaA